jgi:hypothetical protein
MAATGFDLYSASEGGTHAPVVKKFVAASGGKKKKLSKKMRSPSRKIPDDSEKAKEEPKQDLQSQQKPLKRKKLDLENVAKENDEEISLDEGNYDNNMNIVGKTPVNIRDARKCPMGEGKPYPSMPSSQLLDPENILSMRSIFEDYSSKKITQIACFKNASVLQKAIAMLPQNEDDGNITVNFCHPKVMGFESSSVSPLYQEKMFTPMRDLPGAIVRYATQSSFNAPAVLHIVADHVFIADKYINVQDSVCSRKQFESVINRIPLEATTFMYRLDGDEKLHFNMYNMSSPDQHNCHTSIVLHAEQDDVLSSQFIPTLSQKWFQWIYVELCPGLLENFVRMDKFPAAEGKRSSTSDTRFVAIKIFFAKDKKTAGLLLQKFDLGAQLLPVESTRVALHPKKSDTGMMVETETGNRVFLSMKDSTEMTSYVSAIDLLCDDEPRVFEKDEDYELCSTNFVKLSSLTKVCMPPNSRTQLARPILMVPTCYEFESEVSLKNKAILQGKEGIVGIVYHSGRKTAPAAFQIVKSVEAEEPTTQLNDSLPSLDNLHKVGLGFDATQLTDRFFESNVY